MGAIRALSLKEAQIYFHGGKYYEGFWRCCRTCRVKFFTADRNRYRCDEHTGKMGPRSLPGLLTAQQSRVMELLAEGLSHKEIAVVMSLTRETVTLYLSHARRKAKCRTTAQLMAMWMRDLYFSKLDAVQRAAAPLFNRNAPGYRDIEALSEVLAKLRGLPSIPVLAMPVNPATKPLPISGRRSA
jgi:DNA-binding CsgD family transcriptional regulator